MKTYRLPCRKTNIQRIAPLLPPDADIHNSHQTLVLHSPISPLSPGSLVFPDGVMTSLWVTKHQNILPATFISFFTLTASLHLGSMHDDQLKNDINNIKKTLVTSYPRTRYVVVLLGEKSILEVPDTEDRLASIRRATGLDPRTSLFFLPADSSLVETRAFAHTVLATLYPLCVEYYRDLSKHARRKRSRGVIPPPTVPPFQGTSQTLSLQGWNVRYDFKLGVFAEFRQEMEAATRHFEGAYELLMGQDVFESIASWSPRWNEARLLADVIVIRLLRCLLWNTQTTLAVRRWQGHKTRMRDLVDRRGKGSTNYGWEAWEARWARVMAELIGQLNMPVFKTPDMSSTDLTVYALPERAITVGERLHPWHYLHHSGYWYSLMARHLRARQRYAETMPEEDRTSPGQSPASQVASKSYLYDTYLCPEPYMEFPLPGHRGVNHFRLITDALGMTMQEFSKRGQRRAAEHWKLDIAKEMIRNRHWNSAWHIIRPLWQTMSWRREGWWNLVEEVGWALRLCAEHMGDGGSIVSVEWELLANSKHLLPAQRFLRNMTLTCLAFTPRPNWTYDLANCITGLQNVTTRPSVVLRTGDVVSFC